ncbi:hypothetical protein AB0873_32420 [Micromonospora sp. NPDC047707]|uniref:hypothetical protein n=1 Tax=Micromonospora sp. NPDC047707 TaxID=3154498 RepID=UPI0034514328
MQAVRLVRAGFRGATGILQHDGLPLLWGANAATFAALDRELTPDHPMIWRIPDTVYKRYSACNISQGPIALAIDLHPHLTPGITAVQCSLNPEDHRYPGVLASQPESLTTALMSAPYGVASALTHGAFNIDRLHHPQRDTDAAELSRLVQVLPDTALPPLGARLTVTLTDGRVLTRELIQGQDAFRHSWKQVESTCAERRQAAGHPPYQHDLLVSAVASIANLPDTAPLLTATLPNEPPRVW